MIFKLQLYKLLPTHIQQSAVSQHREQRVHVALACEVETRSHVPTGARDTVRVSGVQSVDAFLSKLLDVPLQVGPDFFQQRRADALTYHQLVLPAQAILLHGKFEFRYGTKKMSLQCHT
jgi:hypothetical protein